MQPCYLQCDPQSWLMNVSSQAATTLNSANLVSYSSCINITHCLLTSFSSPRNAEGLNRKPHCVLLPWRIVMRLVTHAESWIVECSTILLEQPAAERGKHCFITVGLNELKTKPIESCITIRSRNLEFLFLTKNGIHLESIEKAPLGFLIPLEYHW